ncbi:MAG: D-aminoacyl-tRNA deacylase [Bradymonadia bacterium]
MRVVVQRVSRAQVTVEGEVVGAIERGFLLLVGIARGDDVRGITPLASKIAGLRVFEDDAGKMNLDIKAVGGAVLAVSQFTLMGDCRKGRRPSFFEAGRPEDARPLFEAFVEALKSEGLQVETGVFQAHMDVELVNDGPVTLLLDSDRQF